MPANGVYKYRFILLDGILYEIINSLSSCVLCIEDYLVFEVHPLERQIDNAHTLPVVLYLLTGAIYYMRYFVGDNKFLILLIAKSD